MKRDLKFTLRDIAGELMLVQVFLRRESVMDYVTGPDAALRRIVELRVKFVAEAFSYLQKEHPSLFERIPNTQHFQGVASSLGLQATRESSERVWMLVHENYDDIVKAVLNIMDEMDIPSPEF